MVREKWGLLAVPDTATCTADVSRDSDTLPPSCAVVTKSGNLNFLEPSGPLQACNGTALHYIQSVPEGMCQTSGECTLC